VEIAQPAFLKIEEAARILSISRSAAYALAKAWLDSGGRYGLPAVRVGRLLRVPRPAIERLMAVGSETDGYVLAVR
jgi:excisionase family DNA binding protein